MTDSRLEFQKETLGHLLADRWMFVPTFQRPYAWDEENIVEFWEDLSEAIRDDSQYFVGAIVLTPVDERWQIIDGQQRLATTSLLLAALRDELATIGQPDLSEFVEKRYLKSFDPDSGEVQPRLKISPSDREFYNDRFIERSGGEASTASQRRLLRAFEILRDRVSRLGDESDESRRQLLKSWIDHLEKDVLVIVVEAASNSDAYQIFETLNDRGASLTIADLLKNYLMSLSPDQSDDIGSYWESAYENLGPDIETNDFVTFIRHFWSSKYGATRERDLYSSIVNQVATDEAAYGLAREVLASSEPYAAMLDSSHGHWSTFSNVVNQAIETLLYFQLGQYRPLLLAATEKFESNEIERLACSMVNWTFRGLIIGGIGGGVTERAYAMAGVNIRSGRLTSAGDVFKQLLPVLPSDESFRNEFEITSVPRTRLLHYILRSQERYLEGETLPALEPYPRGISAPVATPILPRNAGPLIWTGFAVDEANRYVFRIGNQYLRRSPTRTLVEGWTSTREEALSQDFKINEDLADVHEWSPDSIRHRQQAMASLAIRIWPRVPE